VTIVRVILVSTLRMVILTSGATACAESVTIPVTVARSFCADRTQARASRNDRYRAKPDKFLPPLRRNCNKGSREGFATCAACCDPTQVVKIGDPIEQVKPGRSTEHGTTGRFRRNFERRDGEPAAYERH